MAKNVQIKVDDPNVQVEVQRPTPMHDRLREVKDVSQKLHEFLLEFCAERGIELCVRGDNDRFRPIGRPETFIAEFLEIDLDELENEKRRMLIDIRTANARREAERELPMFGRKK